MLKIKVCPNFAQIGIGRSWLQKCPNRTSIIASYAAVREVPYVRMVFCDADVYDAGYLSPEDVAGRVEVKGIEDKLTICRKHAYLIPEGKNLSFRAKGKVFYFS